MVFGYSTYFTMMITFFVAMLIFICSAGFIASAAVKDPDYKVPALLLEVTARVFKYVYATCYTQWSNQHRACFNIIIVYVGILCI